MRREFPDKVKALRFRHCGGLCEGTRPDGKPCGVKLSVGKYHYDHDKTDAEDGPPTFENCRVLCLACHRVKTNRDVKRLAKTERQFRRDKGIRKPRTITRWRNFKGEPVIAGRER